MNRKYEVIVGNVGVAYAGDSWHEALRVYGDYKRQSTRGYGRAAGEGVVLLRNGNVKFEHAEGQG